jgi:hypothetical protein
LRQRHRPCEVQREEFGLDGGSCFFFRQHHAAVEGRINPFGTRLSPMSQLCSVTRVSGSDRVQLVSPLELESRTRD